MSHSSALNFKVNVEPSPFCDIHVSEPSIDFAILAEILRPSPCPLALCALDYESLVLKY